MPRTPLPQLSDESREPLPDLYARWLNELLPEGVPRERHATCGECAMTSNAPLAAHAGRFQYADDTKCCTFQPVMPNFLVGGILSQTAPGSLGHRSILARVASGPAASCLGLEVPADYRQKYEAAGSALFGRSLSMRCPHYRETDGSCSIWEYRNGSCSTFFCKHERGQVGALFWSSVKSLFAALEYDLSIWACNALEVAPADIESAITRRTLPARELLASELNAVTPSSTRTATLEQLFARCWELVSALSFRDALAHCGPAVTALAARTRDRFLDLRVPSLPQHVRVKDFLAAPHSADSVRIATYNYTDPLVLPIAVFSVLRRFNDAPVAEVILRLRLEGVEISEAWVQRLVDFMVLIPAGPDETRS